MKTPRDEVVALRKTYVLALDEQLKQLQKKGKPAQKVLDSVKKPIGNMVEAREKVWLHSMQVEEM